MSLSPAKPRTKGTEALAHLIGMVLGSGFEVGLSFSGKRGKCPEITPGSASEFGPSLGKLG